MIPLRTLAEMAVQVAVLDLQSQVVAQFAQEVLLHQGKVKMVEVDFIKAEFIYPLAQVAVLDLLEQMLR
jgi:hypothetical protein